MGIYYLIAIIFLVAASVEALYVKKNKAAELGSIDFKKIVFFYLAFILFFISAFRFETGNDYISYKYIFQHAAEWNSNISIKRIEKGYLLINLIFHDFYLMQVFYTGICCFLIYKAIYEHSEFPIYTLLLYYCFFFFAGEMGQTRQYIAIAFITYGTKYIEKRQLIKWILIIILATNFHLSSVIAFPLYFTNRISLSKSLAVIILLFCLFMNLFGLKIVWSILKFITNSSIVPKKINGLVYAYTSSNDYGKQVEFGSGLGMLVSYSFYFLVIIFYCFLPCDKRKRPFKNYYLLNFLLGLLFDSMGRNFDQFSRVTNYYWICGYGLVSFELIPSAKKFFRKLDFLRIFTVLMLCSWFFYTRMQDVGSIEDNRFYYKSTFSQYHLSEKR